MIGNVDRAKEDVDFFVEFNALVQKHKDKGIVRVIGLIEFAKMGLFHDAMEIAEEKQ